jgi:hypothetical protein
VDDVGFSFQHKISKEKTVNFVKTISFIVILFCAAIYSAQPAAKISLIEGSAQLLKKGTQQWRTAKLNMSIQIGDELFSDKESLVEIAYGNGEIIRMAENTKLIIVDATETAVK